MSVYIPSMEMPTSCYDCNCFIRDSDGSDYCCLLMRDIEDNYKRDDDCPLVPVPPHGDLIDRDSTIEKIRHLSDEIDKKLGYEKSAPYIMMALYLSNADDFPTIIPAEKAEKEV